MKQIMKQGAALDPTGLYRYLLWREWDGNAPRVVFVMLNPSRADANTDDPRLRRCLGFARSWGCGAIEVVNLFAYRASRPDIRPLAKVGEAIATIALCKSKEG